VGDGVSDDRHKRVYTPDASRFIMSPHIIQLTGPPSISCYTVTTRITTTSYILTAPSPTLTLSHSSTSSSSIHQHARYIRTRYLLPTDTKTDRSLPLPSALGGSHAIYTRSTLPGSITIPPVGAPRYTRNQHRTDPRQTGRICMEESDIRQARQSVV
jgi:hypothetical protein